MKFTEIQLEKVFIKLLAEQGYAPVQGETITRDLQEVILEDDLKAFLQRQYAKNGITQNEIEGIVRDIKALPASDLYGSNRKFMNKLCNGFLLKREKHSAKDLFIELIDYIDLKALQAKNQPQNQAQKLAAEPQIDYGKSNDGNIYKIVNQFTIEGFNKRIPDAILFINGLPLVVFEFKSAIREEATLYSAYQQLTVRYKRDIPKLFVYNAFCVISDGVNNKAGAFFAEYEFFYAWRKIAGMVKEIDGIDTLYTLVQGMFNQYRLKDIIKHFIYMPDTSKKEVKVLCRYPQYYGATKLLANIKKHQKPSGDGKGGTYFGATGCGKSFTMLFLTRLLVKNVSFSSPTIILITDRTDLDDQLSGQFTNAKDYIGDQNVVSVTSREDLRTRLQGIQSGGVYLTTIHKFTEDTELLTSRHNVICISDEAHRSQVNLDLKLKLTTKGVKRSYGFAKYLHDSLPNATYVGFTGTPVDATMDVFGEVVDMYTMTESVKDDITVRIVYEGRAAKVLLKSEKLKEIEAYYQHCAEEGSSEHQIEQSKKAISQMNTILGDPDRLQAVAKDFVQHYETRLNEGSTVKGKALFVCSSREIAYRLYQYIIAERPEWAEKQTHAVGEQPTPQELKKLKPMEMIKMIMTRGKDDSEDLYRALGTKQHRKELDRQFKNEKSNFKIAIVVDMWLTGFDVPTLDTIYIDKPIQQHSLIQTISRVNRKTAGKETGLVVDYIGIKKQMNIALKKYSGQGNETIEDIEKTHVVFLDHLDLLDKMFHAFDATNYFNGDALAQLHTLNMAAEHVQASKQMENRFMNLAKRLKAAYDIVAGSEKISPVQREKVHFYLAVKTIIFKLTRGTAPDASSMNRKVLEMIDEAIKSQGVEEIFKLGDEGDPEIDIFDEQYMAMIAKIKMPQTKIKLLQKLLKQAIDRLRVVNKMQGVDFTKRMEALVSKYNERREKDGFGGEVFDDITDEITEGIIALFGDLKKEMDSFKDMGIDFEEKAFYDILKAMAHKYDFEYPEEKLLFLAKEVKTIVDDKAKYTDWDQKESIKSELKVELILLLDAHDYPPVDKDEVYKEIFEQAENFKKYRMK